MTAIVLEADLTWTDRGFEPGVQIAVGDNGRIEAVGALGRTVSHRLERLALLPGFVNAHSHAFQRGLRGAGERFPHGAGSFWTWRDAMYGLVGSLDHAGLRRLSAQAFGEMRDAGITSVGEFHYVHHDQDADYALDEAVLEAAAEIGIRIVLVNAFYSSGGVGRPIEPGQWRFATASLDGYWRQMDRLSSLLDPATQSLGVAAHSIRAVRLEEIAALHAEASRRGLRFHMHVEEQRREVEESVAVYGKTPMAVLNDALDISGNFTAVHCTHTTRADRARFLDRGGAVCCCPLTEANLGDGLPDLSQLDAAGGQICLGSDSNARIDVLEEMRWLEYGQRLRREARGALVDVRGEVAPSLLAAATTGGARALALDAARIAAERWADFVAIDLTAPGLAGVAEEQLLDAMVFGAGNEVIAGTFVGGRWRATRGAALPGR